MACDPGTLTDQSLNDAITNFLPDISRASREKTFAVYCDEFFNRPPEEEPPPLQKILWGMSYGTDGATAVDRGLQKVLVPAGIGEPGQWCTRTYAAGGPGAGIKHGANRYPGTPQVYGPKTMSTDKRQWNTWLAEWLALDPNLDLTPWPENDRHDIKKSSGWTSMTDWIAMMECVHEVLRDDFGRTDVLWANPTGWDIENRWNKYVEPVLGYVAGVAVDGYSYQKEWTSPQAKAEAEFWVWESTQDPEAHLLLSTDDPTGGFTQATMRDAEFVAKKCRDSGKEFGGFEMGVQSGVYQDELLEVMLGGFGFIHRNICPVEKFIYWETSMTGLDCILSSESSARFVHVIVNS